MCRIKWSFSAFLAALCGSAAVAAAPSLSVTMNPNDEGGAKISVDGAQLTRGTRFTVHSPGWTDRYVRNIRNPRHVKVNFQKTKTGVLESVTETVDNVATLDEYSVECKGNTAVVTTVASMRKKKPAQVETVFGLAPWVCENARYEVVTADGKKLTGRIPEEELASQFEGAVDTSDKIKLLPPIVKGVFRTARGIVTVEVLEGPALALDDRRTSRMMAWGKSFILWSSDDKMPKPGRSFRQVVRITYDVPEKSGLSLVPLSIPDGLCKAVECPADPAPDFPLLPRPQSCTFTGSGYQVQPGDKLTIPGGSARFARHAERFARRYGLEVVAGDGKAARGIRVVYGPDMDDERYTIRVGKNGATVRAKGERGAFYALWTLRGLERNGVFSGAEIEDAPAFPKRAIHANADSDTRRFTGEMIEKVFAPLKINTIILECPYIRWKALEGKYRYKGMPKEDLPAFLDLAEEYYIKVYPLIPTYSHSEWFFWNGKDNDLRENPRDARSYDALNPKVYEKLAVLFDEVLEAFRSPEYFHISHDELHDNPTREAGKKIGVKTLFYNDIMWHHEFFKKRGVKLMMWHDMLVSNAENKHRPVANARGGTEELR
ncbi:MAG: family 20 glycosylhydrolase, partial [Lentisphaeria bacterium]|nr:family 20 glycosylhydrolase [Lentisphaeria bacterium]